jgi:hypothetical protein
MVVTCVAGEKILWSDDETSFIKTTSPVTNNKISTVLGQKRKKPPKSTTGVGTTRAKRTNRPKNRSLNLGTPQINNQTTE